MNIRKALVGGAAGLAATLAAATTVFAATMVVVTGNTAAGENMPGWLFNRDTSTSSPYSFVLGHSSIGVGSLYVSPIGATPADKFIAENFLNAPVAEVNSIKYDFKIGSVGGVPSDANQFYMNVYANFGQSNDLNFYDCRYTVVPEAGSTASFTTVTFDTTQAYAVTTRSTSPFECPATPAEMDLLSPGSNIRAFALNVGDTSAGDEGLDGYLDNVVVTQNGEATISNFEPTKEACMKGGWSWSENSLFKNQGECMKYMNQN